MPQIFPLSSYGNRMINITLDSGISGRSSQYWVRTYYSEGQIDSWFLDIWDAQMTPLVKGLPVVVGAANLLSSYQEKFPEGSKLIVVQTDGDQSDPDVLGNGLEIIWYSGSEASPYIIPDPMLAANIVDFQIPGQEGTNDHNILNNRFIPNQHNIGAVEGLAESLADKATIEQLNQKLSDAPSDGIVYGRRNAEWVPSGSGGGSGADSTFFYQDGNSVILRQMAR